MSDKAGRTDVHVISTLLLLVTVNGAALFVKNLGLVVSLGGAILGSALVYIYPALMSIVHNRRKAIAARASGSTLPLSQRIESFGCYVLAVLGCFLSAVGAVMSLKSAGGH
uniref:Amino acid transporter transmembrane domain-containing protein n=2 Tax=Haptolina ericina TaxID=156174 RepID=A0A7S3AUI9_9EUKA|mmetsp:Transcript_35379/g.80290  ORF Transcript_35379/g.80290 Transcript_35379/m.80290 type:complete len:111 (+) Transcript_35379:47-379(+)